MASVSISCPSCSATDGVVRNGKSTAGHQRYLCSHCRKTWQMQFTYTASQPCLLYQSNPANNSRTDTSSHT
ncbi:IS1 family transposase, partial [Shigella sonnei]|uniref:IS1 family transposase n=1 Tax=Shigella sonnei TaxID=624 RepID=UPI0033905748